MQIKWLLEREVFQEALIDALLKLGIPHVVCKFGISYETYLNQFTSCRKICLKPAFERHFTGWRVVVKMKSKHLESKLRLLVRPY